MNEIFDELIQEQRLSELNFYSEPYTFRRNHDQEWFTSEKTVFIEKLIREFGRYSDFNLVLDAALFIYRESENHLATTQMLHHAIRLFLQTGYPPLEMHKIYLYTSREFPWAYEADRDLEIKLIDKIIKKCDGIFSVERNGNTLLYADFLEKIFRKIDAIENNQPTLDNFKALCRKNVQHWIDTFQYIVRPESRPPDAMQLALREMLEVNMPDSISKDGDDDQATLRKQLLERFEEALGNTVEKTGREMTPEQRELALYDSIINLLELICKSTDTELIEMKYKRIDCLIAQGYGEEPRGELCDLILSILPYVEIDSVAEIFKEALKKMREISLKDDVELQTLEGFLSMFMPVGQESKMDEILGIASKYDVF